MFQSMVLMGIAPSEPNEHQLAARRMLRSACAALQVRAANMRCAFCLGYRHLRDTW